MNIQKVKYVIWASDLERCLCFYESLGGNRGLENPAGCEVSLHGATLFIHSGGSGESTWTGLTYVVPDIRSAAEVVTAAGGRLLKEIEDSPEEPAHLAYCSDTEGNEFMLSKARS